MFCIFFPIGNLLREFVSIQDFIFARTIFRDSLDRSNKEMFKKNVTFRRDIQPTRKEKIPPVIQKIVYKE